jgi:protein TonB
MTDRQRAQAEAMNHQLNAPSRIPNDLKMLAGREAPPATGFASSGLDGMGGMGSPGNVFSGQNGPKVKIAAPTKMSISAGVAGGLLIQKTSPVYPQIAREARVSGTVVIQATISKSGTIENLRAVSGPTMLRQSALDAVKTWRYRPYMLDGEPVDVETTVSVNFTLGG